MDTHCPLRLRPLAEGRALRVYALEVDGTCEVIEFLDERLQESLAADLRSIILHIAAHGFRTPRNWYRRLGSRRRRRPAGHEATRSHRFHGRL